MEKCAIKVKDIDLGQFKLSKTDFSKISHAYDIFRCRTGVLTNPCFQAYIYICSSYLNLGVVLGVPLKYCSYLRCLHMVLRLHKWWRICNGFTTKRINTYKLLFIRKNKTIQEMTKNIRFFKNFILQ